MRECGRATVLSGTGASALINFNNPIKKSREKAARDETDMCMHDARYRMAFFFTLLFITNYVRPGPDRADPGPPLLVFYYSGGTPQLVSTDNTLLYTGVAG